MSHSKNYESEAMMREAEDDNFDKSIYLSCRMMQ
jgi:hypothetical protein